MDMQDKDFDELFRSKLEDFEQEPSAKVWPEISAKLSSSKRRTVMASWMSIAASIIVLAAVGALFINKKPVATANGKVKRSIAKTSISKVTAPPAPVSPSLAPAIQSVASVSSSKPRGFAREHGKVQPPKFNAGTTNTGNQQAEPAINVTPQLAANISTAQVRVNNPVVPDSDVPLSVKSTADIQFSAKADPPAGSLMPRANVRDSVAARPRHKIHSFGDLVNLVVDKVDKTKEKLVVFSNDDEDDKRLIGVNLGEVKTKKGE
jgi:hypothetical protein